MGVLMFSTYNNIGVFWRNNLVLVLLLDAITNILCGWSVNMLNTTEVLFNTIVLFLLNSSHN